MGRGFPPSDGPTKHKGVAPTVTTLPNQPAANPPALPKPIHIGEDGKQRKGKHRPETLAWYKVWCESVQTGLFLETDWACLHRLANLVDIYYESLDRREKGFTTRISTLSSEIRLTEQKLGATVEDRQRLRWKPDPAAKTTEPAAAKKAARAPRADARLKLVDDQAS